MLKQIAIERNFELLEIARDDVNEAVRVFSEAEDIYFDLLWGFYCDVITSSGENTQQVTAFFTQASKMKPENRLSVKDGNNNPLYALLLLLEINEGVGLGVLGFLNTLHSKYPALLSTTMAELFLNINSTFSMNSKVVQT